MSDKVNQLRQSVGAAVDVQISEDQLRMTALEYATRSTGAVPIYGPEFIVRAGLIYEFLKEGPKANAVHEMKGKQDPTTTLAQHFIDTDLVLSVGAPSRAQFIAGEFKKTLDTFIANGVNFNKDLPSGATLSITMKLLDGVQPVDTDGLPG